MLLASLLRNDSITDWTARSDLYNAMLCLLRRMADCEVTLQVNSIFDTAEDVESCLFLIYIIGSHQRGIRDS